MKPLRILGFLAAIGTVLTATYVHESYRRYDLVTVGAGSGGSGGSQNGTGDTGTAKINAYLIDHRTGRVWVHSDDDSRSRLALNIEETGRDPTSYLRFFRFVPMERLSCADLNAVEVSGGCRPKEKPDSRK